MKKRIEKGATDSSKVVCDGTTLGYGAIMYAQNKFSECLWLRYLTTDMLPPGESLKETKASYESGYVCTQGGLMHLESWQS